MNRESEQVWEFSIPVGPYSVAVRAERLHDFDQMEFRFKSKAHRRLFQKG